MKIKDLLAKGSPSVSFEVFPPKKDAPFEPVKEAVARLACLNPSFISVTYGASGHAQANTAEIASFVQACGTPALAHLTCLTSSRERIADEITDLRSRGIENILCLRGACYPECHPECAHLADDIAHLKEKVDAGLDFLTTQMFFDNNVFYRYLAKLRGAGIVAPVIAGIMPVTNGRQIKRICQLSGTYLPSRFKAIVDRFGDDPESMLSAGVVYAAEQIVDLFANGVNAVHVYTMNRPEVAA